MFRKEALKNHQSLIVQKLHVMLDGLLKTPEKFDYHNKMYVYQFGAGSSCLLIHIPQVIYFNSNENDVRIRSGIY